MAFETDLKCLHRIVDRDPSFNRVDPDHLTAGFTQLKSANTAEPEDFALRAMRLMALAGNAHTRIIPNSVARIVPMRLVWLADGPCLVDGDDRFRSLRGSRLLSVNDLDPGELHRRFEPYLAGNAARRRAIGAIMLVWPRALSTITGRPATHPPELRFDCVDGQIRTIRPRPDDLVTAAPYYTVHDPGMAGRLNRKMKALPDDATQIHCHPCPQHSAWYVRLPTFADTRPETLASGLATISQRIARDRLRSLIVDLRGNPGGDFIKATPFVERVNEMYEPGGACLVLVDKFTFSAAIVVTALLKHRARNCRIIGEPMGDDEQFFAEGDTDLLPQSGLSVRYSSAYHDWRQGIPHRDYTPSVIGRHMIAAGSLAPDITVDTTIGDFRSGNDPVLTAALRKPG